MMSRSRTSPVVGSLALITQILTVPNFILPRALYRERYVKLTAVRKTRVRKQGFANKGSQTRTAVRKQVLQFANNKKGTARQYTANTLSLMISAHNFYRHCILPAFTCAINFSNVRMAATYTPDATDGGRLARISSAS